jgi:hypothetical protein
MILLIPLFIAASIAAACFGALVWVKWGSWGK